MKMDAIDTNLCVYENKDRTRSNSAVSKTSGMDLIVNCFGQMYDDEEDQLFDYYSYKKWHLYKRLIEKWERRFQIKLQQPKEIIDDLSDRILKNEMAKEFGVINENCQAFEAYFKIFSKERRKQIHKWKKIENEIEGNELISLEAIEAQIYYNYRKISGHSFCEDFQTEILEYKCDWFQAPRTYNFNVSSIGEFPNHLVVVYKERQRILDSLLAKTKANTCTELSELPTFGGHANFSILDLAFVFPHEILQCKNVSLKLSIQLKTIINQFPYGVVEEVFMSRFQEKYGTLPNFLEKHYPTFLLLCNVYVDIFYVPKPLAGLDGKQLIFPAYWYGVLDSVDSIVRKLWHMINVIVIMNSGLIDLRLIIPKMQCIFNIDLTPENWGFSSVGTLIQYFMDCISNENDLIFCFARNGITYLSCQKNCFLEQ